MAKIIKAEQVGESFSSGRMAYQLEDVTRKADRLLASAREEAERLVELARQQADEIRRHAEVTGYEAALVAARQTVSEEVQQRLNAILPTLEHTAGHVAEAAEVWHRRQQRQLIQLACKIAQRVVRRELRHDPRISLDWVREALELVSGGQRISIRLHPDDHDLLQPHVAQLTNQFGISDRAEIVADERVEAGGCLVQSEFGEIDQQLETQLNRIEEELSE
jgi:flagellar assembly protein FliH